jgi:hypothetical protein
MTIERQKNLECKAYESFIWSNVAFNDAEVLSILSYLVNVAIW